MTTPDWQRGKDGSPRRCTSSSIAANECAHDLALTTNCDKCSEEASPGVFTPESQPWA